MDSFMILSFKTLDHSFAIFMGIMASGGAPGGKGGAASFCNCQWYEKPGETRRCLHHSKANTSGERSWRMSVTSPVNWISSVCEKKWLQWNPKQNRRHGHRCWHVVPCKNNCSCWQHTGYRNPSHDRGISPLDNKRPTLIQHNYYSDRVEGSVRRLHAYQILGSQNCQMRHQGWRVLF